MMDYWIYLGIMALSTYLIRAFPLVLAHRKIENPFLRSFLHYIPFSVLTALTFPSGLYATGNPVAAGLGMVAAAVLAGKIPNLTLAAGTACATALVTDWLMGIV